MYLHDFAVAVLVHALWFPHRDVLRPQEHLFPACGTVAGDPWARTSEADSLVLAVHWLTQDIALIFGFWLGQMVLTFFVYFWAGKLPLVCRPRFRHSCAQ